MLWHGQKMTSKVAAIGTRHAGARKLNANRVLSELVTRPDIKLANS
jgi:hypothetical protein